MLALIFFLCLAIVGVVGELTDVDLTKIGSLLDKRDERLYTILGTLETKVDALETKVDALETKFDAKFDALETKFDAKFDALETKVDALETKFDDYHQYRRT